MVTICFRVLNIRCGLSAHGTKLTYASLSVVLKLFVFSASGDLSKNSDPFVLKRSVSRTGLSYSYLYCFCAAVSSLWTVSLIKTSLGKRRSHICAGLSCCMSTRKPPTQSRVLLVYSDILAPNWMRTHLPGNGLVCHTYKSIVGRICSSYPGFLRRKGLGAYLLFWHPYRPACLLVDDTQWLSDASGQETFEMFRKPYSRIKIHYSSADDFLYRMERCIGWGTHSKH